MNALQRLAAAVEEASVAQPFVETAGVVREVAATHYRVRGLSSVAKLGDRVRLGDRHASALCEVVRIDEAAATIKPYDARFAVGIGTAATLVGAMCLRPSQQWRGRVINALGEPIDGQGPLANGERSVRIDAPPPAAMTRARIKRGVRTGVRAVDLFTPLCQGQRIGIFSGSGVGKSTLLSMLARSPAFDTVVVALVGERGREVREFLEGPLAENRARAVTVVSTGDESPMMRRLALVSATAVAEYFRDGGDSVLLIADSVTRYAHAARDVALAAGEPAVARGYTPSVFSDLPKLLERAGPGPAGAGSITGLYAVLVDGDDHNDPIADAIRGTLDGHIVLDRAIADQGRYPAISILASISRLADIVWTTDQRTLVRQLRTMVARYEDTRDLRLMGGYHAGTDPDLDRAVTMVPRIYEALRQEPAARASSDAFGELALVLRPQGHSPAQA
jgi:flagellum-specific ATP synthase